MPVQLRQISVVAADNFTEQMSVRRLVKKDKFLNKWHRFWRQGKVIAPVVGTEPSQTYLDAGEIELTEKRVFSANAVQRM
jgi:hypothetical protein